MTRTIQSKDGRRRTLGVRMVREEGRWLVHDIDFLPDKKSIAKFLDGFREANPDARAVPSPEEEKSQEPGAEQDDEPKVEEGPEK